MNNLKNICNQIKKYESCLEVNPLIPSSFKDIDENITYLQEESSTEADSVNIMTKIKNIELFQSANSDKFNLIGRKKCEIPEQKPILSDLVNNYSDSLDIEEIKDALRSNTLFFK